MTVRIITGDCRQVLASLPDEHPTCAKNAQVAHLPFREGGGDETGRKSEKPQPLQGKMGGDVICPIKSDGCHDHLVEANNMIGGGA